MDPEAKHGVRAKRALATGTEKAYMGIAIVEAIIVSAVAWAYFGLIQVNVPAAGPKTRTVPVYISIFCFAQLFSLAYVYDALRARNVIQLCLHTFFNLCILAYACLQISQTRTALSDLEYSNSICGNFSRCFGQDSLFNVILGLFIVTPIVVGLATIAFAFLIRKLFQQFGWSEFHLVGADPRLKRESQATALSLLPVSPMLYGATVLMLEGMHREYQTLVSLLKLLFFFAISFCLAFLILVITAKNNTAEFAITIVAMPITPIVILACGYAVRKENRPLMFTCLCMMVLGLAYFVYKLSSMFLPYATGLYINTRITMVLFACFAIVILLVTFTFGVICMNNFGQGLIEAHRNPENKTSLLTIPLSRKQPETEYESGTKPEQARLMID